MNPAPHRPSHPFTAALVAGLVCIALGIALLLDRMHAVSLDQTLRFWPLVLVLAGIQKLVSRGFLGSTGGHVLILVGLGLQAAFLEHWAWVDNGWPVAVIWVGLIITLRALRPAKPQPVCQDDEGSSR